MTPNIPDSPATNPTPSLAQQEANSQAIADADAKQAAAAAAPPPPAPALPASAPSPGLGQLIATIDPPQGLSATPVAPVGQHSQSAAYVPVETELARILAEDQAIKADTAKILADL